MVRLRVLAVGAVVVFAAPALAETASNTRTSGFSVLSKAGSSTPMQLARPGYGFPVLGYPQSSGPWQPRHGIIAGTEIARGTMLGLGIFQTSPKMRGFVGGVPENMAPKRKKSAAVGLSMKF